MKKIYDFRCLNGHLFESYAESETKSMPCEICNQASTTVVSCAGFMLDPISGDYPTATRKWAKMRQEKIKAERRVANS